MPLSVGDRLLNYEIIAPLGKDDSQVLVGAGQVGSGPQGPTVVLDGFVFVLVALQRHGQPTTVGTGGQPAWSLGKRLLQQLLKLRL
jgi:hypothetical protein